MLAIRETLRTNSEMIRRLRDQVEAVSRQMKPMLDAMETMEAGIRMLGRIGRFGERFGRIFLFLIAISVIAKVLLTGGTWSDATAAFYRIIGR